MEAKTERQTLHLEFKIMQVNRTVGFFENLHIYQELRPHLIKMKHI